MPCRPRLQNVVIGAIIVLAVGIDMWRAELAAPAAAPSSHIDRRTTMSDVLDAASQLQPRRHHRRRTSNAPSNSIPRRSAST